MWVILYIFVQFYHKTTQCPTQIYVIILKGKKIQLRLAVYYKQGHIRYSSKLVRQNLPYFQNL